MKQRKKIKYVQKQPPDKLNSQNQQNNNTQPQQTPTAQTQNIIYAQVEEQISPQTYLVEPNNPHYERHTRNQPYRKEQYKPRYMPKDETHPSRDQQPQSYNKQPRDQNRYADNRRGQPRRRQPQLAPPQFVQRESSHHDMGCLVCSQQIHRKQPIWTCECCCISMHLRCIKKWIEKMNQQLDKKAIHIFNWKCPQCNYEYNEPMPKYYCYCGKHLNPEYDRDLLPHSCGQICTKKRGPHCPHPCPQICHSGKCRPCEHEGTLVTCQCGKTQRSVKCSEERLAFQCGKKCERILNCHKHKCERNCHTGECQPCKKKKMAKCFCGKGSEVVDCSLPAYSCGEVCGKVLDCSYHKCEMACHDGSCNSCRHTPALQKTCPCGKYQIELLTGDPDFRKSCSDPIPVCGMPCSRKLDCGHVCPRSCHEGPCPPCKVIVEQNCSCSSQTRKIECHQKAHHVFKCELVCKRKRSCGNHICNTVCCPHRNSPIPDNHPCELNCTKMLNCGKHECGEACHMGLCKRCPVIYSQAQPCPCGRTSLKPPIICGTLVPECDNPCDKELTCGHRCKNICHYGNCKCYEQVSIACRCGKQSIKTTCGREALCLTKCQLILPCSHKCELQCHKGTCEEAHKSHPCRKICGKERADCKHLCPQLCHPEQECESFPCEAEILVKCECGHRQTMTLCGAHDHHKTKKAIICNKKCENLKRFDIFYKDKTIYYPGNMVQFAFKNYPYLQNLQSRLQKFILHSDQNFIEVQFKFPDNSTKLLLTNLFENHYHLNTHFYRHRKYAAFSLMQSEDTMVPKPVLSEYVKLISKGIVKQSNLPFEFTISYEVEQKEKGDVINKSIKQYLHKYYSERNGKYVSLHFWSRRDGEEALQMLENQYQTIEFKCSENIIKQEEEVATEDIIYTEDISDPKDTANSEPKQQKQQSQIANNPKVEATSQPQPPTHQKKQIPVQPSPQKGKLIINQNVPKLIVRKGIPTFRKNDYPDSKQNIQDVYLLDEEELFNEAVDWQQLVKKLSQKKMGPQAIEWRIRAFIIINSFSHIEQAQFYQQFDTLIKLYNKDKEAAMRILQIQRIDNKSVKKEMQQNGIYLSDHQPQILSYLQLYNYMAEEKIPIEYPEVLMNTREVTKSQEIIESVEKRDSKSFYEHFINSDYVYSCALIPLVHCLRQNVLQDISKGGRFSAKDLYKYLLFNSKQSLESFFKENGIVVDIRVSKSTKEQIYYLNSGQIRENPIKNNDFIKETVFEKRDKKYFLVEPEQLFQQRYMTRSFFAFGDFKESISPNYMNNLVKILKQKQ